MLAAYEIFDAVSRVTVASALDGLWRGLVVTLAVVCLVNLARWLNARTRYVIWTATLMVVFGLTWSGIWSPPDRAAAARMWFEASETDVQEKPGSRKASDAAASELSQDADQPEHSDGSRPASAPEPARAVADGGLRGLDAGGNCTTGQTLSGFSALPAAQTERKAPSRPISGQITPSDPLLRDAALGAPVQFGTRGLSCGDGSLQTRDSDPRVHAGTADRDGIRSGGPARTGAPAPAGRLVQAVPGDCRLHPVLPSGRLVDFATDGP